MALESGYFITWNARKGSPGSSVPEILKLRAVAQSWDTSYQLWVVGPNPTRSICGAVAQWQSNRKKAPIRLFPARKKQDSGVDKGYFNHRKKPLLFVPCPLISVESHLMQVRELKQTLSFISRVVAQVQGYFTLLMRKDPCPFVPHPILNS